LAGSVTCGNKVLYSGLQCLVLEVHFLQSLLEVFPDLLSIWMWASEEVFTCLQTAEVWWAQLFESLQQFKCLLGILCGFLDNQGRVIRWAMCDTGVGWLPRSMGLDWEMGMQSFSWVTYLGLFLVQRGSGGIQRGLGA